MMMMMMMIMMLMLMLVPMAMAMRLCSGQPLWWQLGLRATFFRRLEDCDCQPGNRVACRVRRHLFIFRVLLLLLLAMAVVGVSLVFR